MQYPKIQEPISRNYNIVSSSLQCFNSAKTFEKSLEKEQKRLTQLKLMARWWWKRILGNMSHITFTTLTMIVIIPMFIAISKTYY